MDVIEAVQNFTLVLGSRGSWGVVDDFFVFIVPTNTLISSSIYNACVFSKNVGFFQRDVTICISEQIRTDL